MGSVEGWRNMALTATESLQEIQENFPKTGLAEVASRLDGRFGRAILGSDKDLGKEIQVEINALADEAKKIQPNYKTDVFKCLEDYRDCCGRENNSTLCAALAVICIVSKIIPFVPKS